jgi:hypothetical protein
MAVTFRKVCDPDPDALETDLSPPCLARNLILGEFQISL